VWVYFIQAYNNLFILPGSTVLEMETSQDQVDRQAECSYGFIRHIAYPPMRTTAYYGSSHFAQWLKTARPERYRPLSADLLSPESHALRYHLHLQEVYGA
jgi:hypothetical protein